MKSKQLTFFVELNMRKSAMPKKTEILPPKGSRAELLEHIRKDTPYTALHVIRFKDKHLSSRFTFGVVGSYVDTFTAFSAGIKLKVWVINDFNFDFPNDPINQYMYYEKERGSLDFVNSILFPIFTDDEFDMGYGNDWYSAANRKSYAPKDFRDDFDHVQAERGKDIPDLLYDLLENKTPHGHETDIFPFIRGAISSAGYTSIIDSDNNIIVRVPKKDGTLSDTMFSSHTDTVHRSPGKIELRITSGPSDKDKDFVFAVEDGKGAVLGADDKVGVYIMLELIKSKIPGLYIFHAGEERGCIGSKALVKDRPAAVKGMKRCIAFDRMNYNDTITSQGGPCCSTEFAKDLSEKLTTGIGEVTKGDVPREFTFRGARGVYTDSAEYTGLIPECSNLSVGYFKQHTRDENFDIYWLLEWFIPTLKKIDWDSLVTVRDHKKKPVSYINNNNRITGTFTGNAAQYQTNIPHQLKSVKVWTPIEGRTESKPAVFKDMLRKWMYKFPYKALEDLEEVVEELETKEDLISATRFIMADIYNMCVDFQANLEECKLKDDYVKLTDELSTQLMVISDDIVEIDVLMDVEEEVDEEEDIPVLGDQRWAVGNWDTPNIIIPHESPAGTHIEFDIFSNELLVNGKVITVFSQKHKKIKTKHLEKISHGTKLFATVDDTYQHVYTVDTELAKRMKNQVKSGAMIH